MCMPVKFLQMFVKVNCCLFILIGIGVEIFTLQNSAQMYQVQQYSTQNAILQAIIGVSMIFLGLIGFIGQKNQQLILMSIYNFGVISIGGLVIFLTILAYVFQQNIKEHQSCTGNLLSQQQKLYNQSLIAQEFFCKDACKCSIPMISKEYLDNHRIVTSPDGVHSYQECANPIIYGYDVIDVLEELELKYDCSGWCTTNPVYMFSNTNNGFPEANCYPFYLREYEIQQKTYFFLYLALDIAFVICLILACCLCLHPNKHHAKKIYNEIYYELAK